MPNTNPTPGSYSLLIDHVASGKPVLFNMGNYPASRRLTVGTWTWRGNDWGQFAGANPTPRVGAAMAYNGTNVFMFGGVNYTDYLQDTWKWDGNVWSLATSATTSTLPAGREAAMMARMSGSNIVMFSGNTQFSGKPLQETWTFNGTIWSQNTPGTSPPPRVNGGFAGDGTNAILFGGASVGQEFNDTWKWNGTNWLQLQPVAVPTIRSECAMTFDAANGVYVMFGGRNTSGILNETWTFDGVATWALKTPVRSPSARVGAQMCYDSARGNVILFGGQNDKDLLGDTWRWDGTNWNQL